MKKALALLLICLPIFADGQTKNKREGKEINWSADRPLTWKDFKGGAKPKFKGHVAQVATQIKFESKVNKTDTIKLYVYAQALKLRSWRVKKTANDYILKHEQLHFDITEVYARKFRQELRHAELNQDNYIKLCNKMFKKYFKALTKEQKKYDKETKHSINEAKQTEWEQKTAGELEALEDFKDPLAIMVLKW